MHYNILVHPYYILTMSSLCHDYVNIMSLLQMGNHEIVIPLLHIIK